MADKNKRNRLAGGQGFKGGSTGDFSGTGINKEKTIQGLKKSGLERKQKKSLGQEISQGFNDIASQFSNRFNNKPIDTSRPSDISFTETSPGTFRSDTSIKRSRDRDLEARRFQANNAEDLRTIKEQIAQSNAPFQRTNAGFVVPKGTETNPNAARNRLTNPFRFESPANRLSPTIEPTPTPDTKLGNLPQDFQPLKPGLSQDFQPIQGKATPFTLEGSSNIPTDQLGRDTINPNRFRSGTLGGVASNDTGTFDIQGTNTSGDANVTINNSQGTVSPNVAASLGKGRGTFNTLSPEQIQSSNRLSLARNAVAELKAKGASADAQLQAFRQITRGPASLQDQFNERARQSLAAGRPREAGKLSQRAIEIGAKNAKIESDRLAALGSTAKTQQEQANKDRTFELNLNKFNQTLSKNDQDAFSTAINLRDATGTNEAPEDTRLSNLASYYSRRNRPIPIVQIGAISKSIGEGLKNAEGVNALIDRVNSSPLSKPLKDIITRDILKQQNQI